MRARLILLVGFLWTVHALMVACGGPAFTTGSGSGGVGEGGAPSDGSILSDADGPVGDAGLDAAATCDADLLRDGLHCGRCGHDCLGGACQNGRCLPVAIATGQNHPLGVAVDKDYVYFANVGTSEIRRISKDGGGVDVLVPNADEPAYLAADVAGSTLYFTEYAGGTQYGKVDSCSPLPACTTLETLQGNVTGPLGIAVDTNSIYVVVNRRQIWRRDKQGGSFTPIWTNDGGLEGLDVDTPYVYVAAQYSGTIFRVNAAADAGADAGAEVVASQIPGVVSVAVDGQGLYFAVQEDAGYVGVVPKARGGGAPRVVVGGLARPTGVAVDARAIYFTTTNDGKVWRLAK